MRGFTLIETLLYIAILSILMVGILACAEELILSSSRLRARAELIYESVYLADITDAETSLRSAPETDSRFELSSFKYLSSDNPLLPFASTASGTLRTYSQNSFVSIPFNHVLYTTP